MSAARVIINNDRYSKLCIFSFLIFARVFLFRLVDMLEIATLMRLELAYAVGQPELLFSYASSISRRQLTRTLNATRVIADERILTKQDAIFVYIGSRAN